MSRITPKPGMTVEISMQGIEKSRLDAIEAAESMRKANEAERAEAEFMRKEGETGRITAEQERTMEEDARNLAESGRILAEESRVTAENLRSIGEQSRVEAEKGRNIAESGRANAEQQRVESEEMRENAEAARVTAEAARANADALRQQTFEDNEANRHTAFESAESARESEWTEIKHGMEISIGTAVADAEDAAKNANSAAESANAAAEKSVRYDAAQTLDDAQKAQARGNIDAADEESVDALKDDLAAITPDDTVVDGKPWASKKTVDSLCMPLEATGNPVQVYPVENYPLGVKLSWEPTQEGEGDPSQDNVRPITGRDAVQVTRCGKNLVKHEHQPGYTETKNGLMFTINDDYSVSVTGTATEETYFNFYSLMNFHATTKLINAMGETISDNGYMIRDVVAQPFGGEGTRLYIVFNSGSTINKTYYPMMVYGEDTAYEPYTGSTTDIALPETVYGGTLDVETGEGIKNWERVVLDGAEKWNKRAVNYPSYSLPLSRRAQTGFCTHLKKILYDAIRPGTGTGETGCYLEFSTSAIFNVPFENVDDWKNYLAAQYAAGTPVYIVFQYAYGVNEPFTATGAQPIPALSGVNTLYTDAGTLIVTGRADPVWLTKSLMERIAALESAATNI